MTGEPLPTEHVIDRLLLAVTGSALVLRFPSYLVALRSFYAREVTLLVSRAAEGFTRPDSLALYVDRVILDSSDQLSPNHVELAEWGQDFVVLPATLNLLGQVANGLAPTRLTSTIMAYAAPVTFYPTGTPTMWEQPAVRRNVEQLRRDGQVVHDPVQQNVYRTSSRRVEVGNGIATPEEVVANLRARRLQPRGSNPAG